MKLKLSDLEGKSKSELLALANQGLKLKEANKSKKQDYYLKNAHAGQIQFHKSKKRIRFVFAGNRGGKTSGGINEFAWLNMGTHPFKKCRVPIKSAIVLQDFETHCKNVLEPKLNEWVDPRDIKKIERNQMGAIKKIVWTNGSITDIYSHDQNLKVYEGTDYDVIWFDEPPPRKIWVAMWRGCTDRGGIMYFTGTPLSSPWLYQEYNRLKDGGDEIAEIIQFESQLNATNLGEGDLKLGQERLEQLASQYTPEERDARLNGGFVQLQGLIFKTWSQGIHVIDEFELRPGTRIIESIDPHPSKDWAVAWVAMMPNGAKILLRGCYFAGVIDEVANQILLARATLLPVADGTRANISRCLIDNASSVPMWSRSFSDPTARRVSVREELESLIGPNAGGPRVEVAPKNVAGKIDLFKRWLHSRERNTVMRPDFFVFNNEDSFNFIDEIEGYIWDRKRNRDGEELKATPVKKKDDLLDAVMQVVLIVGETIEENDDTINIARGLSTYGLKQQRGM